MLSTYTVLLLVSDTGAGHRRAAEALSRAIELIASDFAVACADVESGNGLPRYHVRIVDAFAHFGSFPLPQLGKMYAFATRYAPGLYGALFGLTNHRLTFTLLPRLLYSRMGGRFTAFLRAVRPDVVVCIHPLLGHVTVRALGAAEQSAAMCTVVTDLATPHAGWISSAVTWCSVPTEAAATTCRGHGLAEPKLRVLGMPVDIQFSSTCNRTALAHTLGLDQQLPTALLVGGGDGVGKITQLVSSIVRAGLPMQLIIVTGRNARLRQRLERLLQNLPSGYPTRCRIFGFAPNMHELMAVANVVITKAGPSTIAEAVAARLPIVLFGHIPGQEEGNVEYVHDQGIGLVAETPEKVVQALRSCLVVESSPVLGRMRANMERLEGSSAAFDIARCILELTAEPQLEPRRLVVAEVG